jgi:hypothetical protein
MERGSGTRGGAEQALNRLGPFEPDAPWDELPQAFMAMDVEHWGLLGTSRWVQRGEPRGLNEFLLEMDNQWDRTVAVKPVKGQPRPPLRTKMDGWVTVLCLFAGIGGELEWLLQAGIRVRKLLVGEIDPVATHPRILGTLSASQIPGPVASRRLRGAADGSVRRHQTDGDRSWRGSCRSTW